MESGCDVTGGVVEISSRLKTELQKLADKHIGWDPSGRYNGSGFVLPDGTHLKCYFGSHHAVAYWGCRNSGIELLDFDKIDVSEFLIRFGIVRVSGITGTAFEWYRDLTSEQIVTLREIIAQSGVEDRCFVFDRDLSIAEHKRVCYRLGLDWREAGGRRDGV